MLRFVIIAAPRTGSNLLCTLLNSHPEILCHHEVFNPRGIFTALSHRNGQFNLGSLASRDADSRGFLERVWRTGRGYRAVGFKWTRGQNETALRSVLADPDIRKIVLRRRNRVKTFISEKIAKMTDQWEVYREQELLKPRPRVAVSHRELREHIAVNDRFYAELDDAMRGQQPPRLLVDYESLFDSCQQRRLLEFLSLRDTSRPLNAASVKQNSSDLRDSIANFEELAAQLDGQVLQAELFDREQ